MRLTAFFCHRNGVIPGRTVGFIRPLALFIHHDQSQILHWCKDSTSRADNDFRLAGCDAAPGLTALSQRQFAVDHRNNIPEQAVKPFHDLRCQRNFRHHQDHLFATLYHRVDQSDKHAGLAAAGHAVQQKAVHSLFQGCDHPVIDCLLFRRQDDIRGLLGLSAACIRVHRRFHRIAFHHAILHQLFCHSRCHAAEIARLLF